MPAVTCYLLIAWRTFSLPSRNCASCVYERTPPYIYVWWMGWHTLSTCLYTSRLFWLWPRCVSPLLRQLARLTIRVLETFFTIFLLRFFVKLQNADGMGRDPIHRGSYTCTQTHKMWRNILYNQKWIQFDPWRVKLPSFLLRNKPYRQLYTRRGDRWRINLILVYEIIWKLCHCYLLGIEYLWAG